MAQELRLLLIEKEPLSQTYKVYHGIHLFQVRQIVVSSYHVNGYWQIFKADPSGHLQPINDVGELHLAFKWIETQYTSGITGGTDGGRRVADQA